MKNYRVTVNGVAYDVVVEELGVNPYAPAPMAAPAPVAAPAAAGSVKVEAPMGGTVTKVLVKVGDAVKSGATLLTFEAMKMEQEIKAPADGTVASVNISQGATMNQGDLLVSLN